MIYSNIVLSQKLERTEARSNAAIVETRAKIQPESAAQWIEVAGAYAMFDDVASPLTQTFGLGLFDEISEIELTKIEDFFVQRGAAVCHEVSPLAHPSLIPLLNKQGYQPIELTTVMFKPLTNGMNEAPRNPSVNTRIIGPGEEYTWAKTSAQGWASEAAGLSDFMLEFGAISAQCRDGFPFIGELNRKPISTGMLFIFDDIALLAGTSTIPEARGQGAHSALLDSRLEFAANQGCKIAMMCAAPGSQSQHNAEKYGFRIAYTRTKWQLRD